MHSQIITTRTACTAPSTAPRRRVAPAHHPHRPRVLLFANMLGRSIAAVCFTHGFQPEHEFASGGLSTNSPPTRYALHSQGEPTGRSNGREERKRGERRPG